MKGLMRVVAIVVLALVYCLEIGSVYNYSTQKFSNHNNNENVVYAASVNLLGSSSNAENLVVSFNNTCSIAVKDLFKSFITTVKITQQIFDKEYTQYTFTSINFQILFRKTDLIFPFNYFW